MIRRCVAFGTLLALLGCAGYPTPDRGMVRWGTPDPVLSARVHAARLPAAVALVVLPTGSMEPYLTGGDGLVGDFTLGWETIRPGDLLTYDPNWADETVPLVTHMAVAKTGDRWIMTGIANTYSEAGSRALAKEDFRAKVVAVYTQRQKP